jgi:UDP-3-O-[3-hydroxymyristoyl] glucosamine N-acyltransferase
LTSSLTELEKDSGERVRTLTARAIADIVGGELRGDDNVSVASVAPLGRAAKDQLSFLGDRRYAPLLAQSSAGVVLISPDLAEVPGNVASRIIVAKPQAALLSLLQRFYPQELRAPAIDATARIGKNVMLGNRVSLDAYAVIEDGATIGDDSWIGAHCHVGRGVTIGSHCRLFPSVTVYSGAILKDRVILHSGVRIASDGFGYVFTGKEHAKIPHVGKCIIESDVEIGANTTVDRGSIDDTMIGAGTKIDNLVQIGHNVKVGSLCLIMSQVGIAGSSQIGDGCVLAGQAGLGGHINVGAGAKIGGQSGVFGNVPPGETWSGYPARPHRESLRATGALFKLSELIKDLERLIDERKSK